MNYKGYTGKIVDFDEETGYLHGRVLGIRDVVTFEALTIKEAIEEFQRSVNDYLAFCAEQGKDPAKPYSGVFNVRLAPEVHRDVAIAAETAGVSLNTWVSDTLIKAANAR